MFKNLTEIVLSINAFPGLQLFAPSLGPADELLAAAAGGWNQVPVLMMDVVSASFVLFRIL